MPAGATNGCSGSAGYEPPPLRRDGRRAEEERMGYERRATSG
jgi:hypothetical protein